MSKKPRRASSYRERLSRARSFEDLCAFVVAEGLEVPPEVFAENMLRWREAAKAKRMRFSVRYGK